MARLSVYSAAIIALLAFLWFAQSSFNDYRLQLVILVGINIVFAVSLTMFSGYTGVFSLGHVGFMGIGAYVGALISLPLIWKDPILLPGLPTWLAELDTSGWPDALALAFACVLAGIIATIVAVVVGYP